MGLAGYRGPLEIPDATFSIKYTNPSPLYGNFPYGRAHATKTVRNGYSGDAFARRSPSLAACQVSACVLALHEHGKRMQQCKLVYFSLSSRGPPSPAGPPGEVDHPTLPYPKHDSACAAAHAPHTFARQGHQCRQLCTPLSLALSNSDSKPGHARATAQAPTLVPHQRRHLHTPPSPAVRVSDPKPGRAQITVRPWSCARAQPPRYCPAAAHQRWQLCTRRTTDVRPPVRTPSAAPWMASRSSSAASSSCMHSCPFGSSLI